MRPDVPIIMITAYGDAETKRKARQRTQLINALRAHLAELGIAAAQGREGIGVAGDRCPGWRFYSETRLQKPVGRAVVGATAIAAVVPDPKSCRLGNVNVYFNVTAPL